MGAAAAEPRAGGDGGHCRHNGARPEILFLADAIPGNYRWTAAGEGGEDVDLRQLRYFVAVAEELHFGRAALRLHISQPPLSLTIRQLEREIGALLFERDNKTVALTAAGAVLYREARQLLRRAEEVADIAARAGRGLAGRLRLGFVSAMLSRGLPEGVRVFQRQAPEVEVELCEMNTEEQIRAVAREQIDVGLIHAGALPGELSRLELPREPFLCCLPPGHPLAGGPTVRLERLRDEDFILFPRALSTHYHDRIVALCVAAGFSPRIRHEPRHWHSVTQLVEANMGVALAPASLRAAAPRAVWLPLAGAQAFSESLCIWRRQADPAAQRLIAAIAGAMEAQAAARGPA
nr:LysR family transcriptional regulator [Chromobacterium alkanivorans]